MSCAGLTLPTAGRSKFPASVSSQLRGRGWVGEPSVSPRAHFVWSAQLHHVPQGVPRVNQDPAMRCACPRQPALAPLRAPRVLVAVSGYVPQPWPAPTYSQSSLIFCSTEGSWFLQRERSRLPIPSAFPPPSFAACDGDNSSFEEQKVPNATSSHQDSQGQCRSGEMRKPPPESRAPACPVGRTRQMTPTSASPWAAR